MFPYFQPIIFDVLSKFLMLLAATFLIVKSFENVFIYIYRQLKRHLLFLFSDISEFFLFFRQTDRKFIIAQLYET